MNKISIKIISALFLLNISFALYSQNVGITTTGASPDPSAQLDISSITMGVLPPRLTDTQITNMPNLAIGLIIYNSTTNCLEMNTTGTPAGWVSFSCCTCCSVTTTHGTESPTAGSITGWTVPCGITSITVTISGAGGGAGDNGNYPAGGGASFIQIISVTPLDVLELAPGTKGTLANSAGGGGGGGSFVYDNTTSTLLMAAGGGGYSTPAPSGSTTTAATGGSPNQGTGGIGEQGGAAGPFTNGGNGGAGAGWLGNGGNGSTDGGSGGNDYANELTGGVGSIAGSQLGGAGGFGGGGGGGYNGGGGGGGDNGGGGESNGTNSGSTGEGGGGGGSGYYNGTSFVNPSGTITTTNTGNGSITIVY
jgi:hypothetical protein